MTSNLLLRIVFGLGFVALLAKAEFDNDYELIPFPEYDDFSYVDWEDDCVHNITYLLVYDVTSTMVTLQWNDDPEICTNTTYSLSWEGTKVWDPETSTGGSTTTHETQYTVTNLVPYADYTFCVENEDFEEMGQACNETQTLQGEPGPPTNASPSGVSSSSVTLTWGPPVDPNGIVTSYLVSWSLNTEQNFLDEGEAETNQTFLEIDDLLACGSYVFNVRAETENSDYGDPDVTSAVTLPEVPPPVTNLIAQDIGARSVNLTWDAPDTNCAIVSYSLTGNGTVLWEDSTVDENETLEGGITFYLVEDLTPYTNYSLCLEPITLNFTGNETCTSFQTEEDVPTRPQDLSSSSPSTDQIILEWTSPEEANGVLVGYQVRWSTPGEGESQEDSTDSPPYVIEGVQACLQYSVDVSAMTAAGEGDPSSLDVTQPSEVPPAPEKVTCHALGSESALVIWSASDTTCPVLQYNLVATGIVLWYTNQSTTIAGDTVLSRYTFENLVPYTEYTVTVNATTEGGTGEVNECIFTTEEGVPDPPQYVDVVEDDSKKNKLTVTWMAPNVTNGNLTVFNVTWNEQSTTVPYSGDPSTVYFLELKDLEVKQQYEINVMALTSAGSSDSEGITVSTLGNALAITLGVLIPILLLLILLVAGYFYRDDIKTKMESLRKTHPSSEYEELGELNTYPIPLNQFGTYIARLKNENALNNEFYLLKTSSHQGPTREAEKATNQAKNRYANILPFDETRVHLANDYINANYISSFKMSKFFIAAQGPLDNTLEDFWNLLWQENVDIIVNLTACVEGGKEKCSQYWPNSMSYGVDFGDYSVQTINEEATTLFALRMIEVTHKSSESKRLITQYQFLAWEDFGAPAREEDLLKLLHTVKRNMAEIRHSNRMLVHCSAGVGRTGTFIALWNIIEEIDGGAESVSVTRQVLSLRRQRAMMVQSQVQYLFLYKCVLFYFNDRAKWQVKDKGPSPNGTLNHPDHRLNVATYENPVYEINQEFEGNLI